MLDDVLLEEVLVILQADERRGLIGAGQVPGKEAKHQRGAERHQDKCHNQGHDR